MSVGDPKTAPRRDDLTFLRRRFRPVAVAPTASVRSAPANAAVASPPAGAPAAVADFFHDQSPRPRHESAPPAPASAAPTPAPAPNAPAASNPLDLSGPPAPPAESGGSSPAAVANAPLSPPAASNPLDLSGQPVPPAESGGSSPAAVANAPLSPPAAGPRAPAPVTSPHADRVPHYEPPRARSGASTILTPKDPTVTLTRIQCGVGVLTFEAACSDAVGDLRLGCAYQLRGGVTSVVQYASHVTTAPPKSARPVIIAEHGRYERLTIDLVQSPDVERMILYAFSESDRALNWGGTLVATTFGQARVELPLDRPAQGGVNVMMSIYNIAGEFVLRAEMEQFAGSVRDAVSAYGFDRITWLDARTPLS